MITARAVSKIVGRSFVKVVQFGSLLYCTLEFVADVVLCEGPSMKPTIQSGDIVLTDHLSVSFNKIKKGDIVICKSPRAPQEYICKRVVAMEGDRVFNVRQNSFSSIKRGHIWLEGDNKTDSVDSRSYGQVPYGLLRGRAFFVLWPLNRLGPLGMPEEEGICDNES